jgi:hypothetical protein
VFRGMFWKVQRYPGDLGRKDPFTTPYKEKNNKVTVAMLVVLLVLLVLLVLEHNSHNRLLG